MIFRSLFLIFFLSAFLSSSATSQTSATTGQAWVRVETAGRSLSLEFPPDYLVDAEKRSDVLTVKADRDDPAFLGGIPDLKDYDLQPEIMAYAGHVKLNLQTYRFWKIASAKDLLWHFIPHEKIAGEVKDLKIDDIFMRSYLYQKDDYFYANFYLTQGAKMYIIRSYTKDKNDPTFVRFVKSIVVGGKPIIKNAIADPNAKRPIVSLDSLKTSPEITAALNQKVIEKEAVTAKTDLMRKATDPKAPPFQRPVVLLRSLNFVSPREAEGYKGEVLLKVTLLADGTIGDIFVEKSLSKRLDKICVKRVREVKFLPAMADGKLIDSTRAFLFTFN
jgi:TonB family protein